MQIKTENKAKMFTMQVYSSNFKSTLSSSELSSIVDFSTYETGLNGSGVGAQTIHHLLMQYAEASLT